MNGTLYKQKNSPYWWMKWHLDGKAHYESSKTTDYDEAKRKLAQRVAKREAPDKRAISVLLDDLVADYRINDKRVDWCEMVVDKHLRPAFGKIRVEALTRTHLTHYIQQRKKKGRANATINREMALLRRAFSLADVKFPKLERLEENNTRTAFLTDEEFFRLVRALPEHLKPIIVFAYQTGCRRGEILGLKWSNVDWDKREIYLRPLETKNKQGRTIPLTSAMYRILESIFIDAKEQDRAGKDNFVFTYRYKPLKEIKEGFQRACKDAGLENVRFHDLRRCGVRNLVRAGVSQPVSMSISGHKTVSVFHRYAIVSSDDQHRAIQALEKSESRFEKDVEGLIRGGLSKFAK